MSQSDPPGGQTISQGVDAPSHVTTEETFPMISKMEELITKQDKIIELLEKIAKQSQEGDDATAPMEQNVDEQLPDANIRRRHLKLYRAALNGDWVVAKRIYEKYPEVIGDGISKRRDTALHIAAAAKRTYFVKELVKMMNVDVVAQTNDIKSTALCLAAASGIVELAKVIIERNRAIAEVIDEVMLPIEMAAWLGHKDMVDYLYQETKGYLEQQDRIDLLITLIDSDLYDVAQKLLDEQPELATVRGGNNETALHAFARKDPKASNLAIRKPGFFRRCFKFGAEDVEDKKPKAVKLVECLWGKVILLSDSKISDLIARPWRLVFEAAKQGNIEFLTILIREYPDLIWKFDENSYSIFHNAVLNRQKDIFKLIYQIGSAKDLIVMTKDGKGNNILHLAGLLPPQDRLNIVSGPALQMQSELLWFQEVRKVIQPRDAETKNKEGLTPRALFTEKHEKLREKGEKWMKDTATSCMLVATLIATVVFAASITVPGGNLQDTDNKGLPIFLGKISFKIFAIADAISLVSSTASIVDFLSILTSRYAEDDFLIKLPRRLLIGLATLFISIAAMMVVFSATFFILFNERRLWIAIFATTIASFPVILFIWQHLQLFVDVLRSTYVSDSLFQRGKSNLFHKEEESSKHQKPKQCSVNCFEICNMHCESRCFTSV